MTVASVPPSPPCAGATGGVTGDVYVGLGLVNVPRSMHPGGVDVGMADGSVRLIKNSVNVVSLSGPLVNRGQRNREQRFLLRTSLSSLPTGIETDAWQSFLNFGRECCRISQLGICLASSIDSDSRIRHLDAHPWTDLDAAPRPQVSSSLGPARRALLALGPVTGRGDVRLWPECNHLHIAEAARRSRVTATGETIALIEAYHDPNIASDLKTFDQAYGLPNPTLTVYNLAGQPSDDGWALEESLDVEWAHAIAPGANILVVEASSQTLKGLVAAVNTARNTPVSWRSR